MIGDFVSLFFPNVCLTCDGPREKGLEELCARCIENLPRTDNHLLEIPEFEQRFSGLIKFEGIFVYLFFQKKGMVQKLLHALKYNDRPEIGEVLGRWYGTSLKEAGFQFDLIIPIPLHSGKLKSRGYNQSEHFAIGLSQALSVPVETNTLIRGKANETQTNKGRVERWANVSGAFECANPATVSGKKVLLVDDVLTTGSTLIAAAEPILQCGCDSISFGVIAAAK